MSHHTVRHDRFLHLPASFAGLKNIRRLASFTLFALVLDTVLPGSLAIAAQDATGTNRPAPATYEAEYEVRAMGMRSNAYRRLQATGDQQFSLSHGLSVSVLGANLITVEEKSVFTWDADGAVPLEYQYTQGGVRRREEQVRFDWEQNQAELSRDRRQQTLGINQATLDNLSFSAQLSADLIALPELRTAETLLSYEILDGRRLETHEYRVIGNERINTPAGELDTIKLERLRDSDSGRTTLIWLSPAHQYTLARLSQTEGGSQMELNLKQITWTGNTSGD